MKRLVDELEQGLERALLHAGSVERASGLARRRALKSSLLTLGTATLAGPAAASPGSALTSGPSAVATSTTGIATSASAATSAVKAGVAIGGLKWIVIGALASGAVAVPALRTMWNGAPQGSLSLRDSATMSPTASFSALPGPPAEIPVPADSSSNGRTPSVEDERVGTAKPPEPRPAAAALQLAEEVRSLDRVRATLATHDSRRALEMLDRYQRLFSTPALGPEASLLRIEALVNLGDRDAASSVAVHLLAAHGEPSYRERVRALLGDATALP
jgi:hypothetical protein